MRDSYVSNTYSTILPQASKAILIKKINNNHTHIFATPEDIKLHQDDWFELVEVSFFFKKHRSQSVYKALKRPRMVSTHHFISPSLQPHKLGIECRGDHLGFEKV